MNILLLSFYYEPDLCAGSFRATALVKALLERMPAARVEVVTTIPNRYSTFSAEAPELESRPGLTIHRVRLPQHRSGMADQSRAFAAYAAGALRIVSGRRFDLIAATSSRLMTAVLGSRVARRTNSPLYLDIRDIMVEVGNGPRPRLNGSKPAKPQAAVP